MTTTQLLKNLTAPAHKADVILDTDAYNEIDDQFAIAYLLKSQDKLNIIGFTTAPFFNGKSSSPKDGMEKSYDEIKKILKLAEYDHLLQKVYRGSEQYLPDEQTAVKSESADFIAETAMQYSSECPLYIVAIGAITNVASALIQQPEIAERIVVVWLGGNSHEYGNCMEFNMKQDIAAVRVVMSSAAPFVQLPCSGVVSELRVTKPELEYWLFGKNKLSNYLAANTIAEAEGYAKGKPWSRVIWDISAVAWLLSDNSKFMQTRIINTAMPQYDGTYKEEKEKPMQYVYKINRDTIIEDLFNKLLQ